MNAEQLSIAAGDTAMALAPGKIAEPLAGHVPGSLPTRDHLTRDMGDCGPSLTERFGEWWSVLSFSSPLHKLHLKGRFPLKLLAVPFDPIPGNRAAGQQFRHGNLSRFGHSESIRSTDIGREAPPEWLKWVHSWGWLRDLRAVGPIERSEANLSKLLARRWLASFADYSPVAWAPATTGTRIIMASCYAPFLMPGVDHIHRSTVLNAIARWTRHLERAVPKLLAGIPRMEAATGLLAGSLILPGNNERQRKAEAILRETLDSLLPDGSHILTRSPLDAALVGDLLLTLSQFYQARKLAFPASFTETLGRIRAFLAALRLGDGQPTSWHGGAPDATQIERLGVGKEAAPPRESGYRCLAANKTRILMDTGLLPPLRSTENGHASTLSFQMSDGPHLLVTNCGGEYGASRDTLLPSGIVAGLRSTAGHSTLTLADTNSSRLPDGGPHKRGRVQEVLSDVHSSPLGQWLEAQHDGYRRRFGFYHMRRMFLSIDGDDLRGEDILIPAAGFLARLQPARTVPLAIRFHLAPGVVATIGEDGKSARLLLREKDGATGKLRVVGTWAFQASFNHLPGKLSIEPSLHVAADGTSLPIQQLQLTGEAREKTEASVGWSFKRMPGTAGETTKRER